MLSAKRFAIIILMMTVFWGQPLWATVIVRFDPVNDTRGLGDVFTIDILADIPDPVVGWGLDLAIDDPSILSIVGAPVIGALWESATAPDGDGLAALAYPNSVSGMDILLATVTFSADGVGETDLNAMYTSGDLAEGFPLDPTGFADVTFEPGHVAVIPEPTTALLISLGGLLSRRRQRVRFNPRLFQRRCGW